MALPVTAQTVGDSVVIFGRVEDAVSREPVEGALVVSGDSATAVFADSLGDCVPRRHGREAVMAN